MHLKARAIHIWQHILDFGLQSLAKLTGLALEAEKVPGVHIEQKNEINLLGYFCFNWDVGKNS